MTEQKSFWLKNMIVLGHGAPNIVKKVKEQGRCACIWSEEMGYCRIFPIPYGFLHDWEITDVEVRKPSNDGRENTFIIYNYENDWNKMYLHIKVHKNKENQRIKLSREEWIKLTKRLAVDSFSDIRDKKRSFGIIEPLKLKGYLKENKESPKDQQTTLFDMDNLIMNQKDYKWIPYIEYSCSAKCLAEHPHKSKIVEWGCYQWLRKHPNNQEHCEKVFDNLEINQEGWKNYLLIGNIRTYPKTYVIIKVIRFKGG
jgi:hypothetical protein